jgi:hypothetical protein
MENITPAKYRRKSGQLKYPAQEKMMVSGIVVGFADL